MPHNIRFAFRFLILAWISAMLLTVSGCASPSPNADESAVASAEPEPTPIKEVHAELVADVARVEPGDSFRIGVRLTIPKGSHIYWKNPGASGLPTWVEWTFTDGVEAGELRWPVPKRFEVEGWDEVSFGYESEVLLFMEVGAPESMSHPQALSIAAQVYWLNCEEDGQCIPGKAELQLELPVGTGSESSRHASSFERYRQRVPIPLDAGAVPLSIEQEEDASFIVRPHTGIRIDFDGPGEGPDFFPDEGEAWTFEGISGAASGSPKALRFIPPEDESVTRGVLKIPAYWEDTGNRKVFYILLSE